MDTCLYRLNDLQTLVAVQLLNLHKVAGPGQGGIHSGAKYRARRPTNGIKLVGIENGRICGERVVFRIV